MATALCYNKLSLSAEKKTFPFIPYWVVVAC